jgi:polyisoprenoid-binding protein YceI
MMQAMQHSARSLLIALTAAGLLAGAAAAEPARYELDPAHTTVAFLVEHVGYAKTLGQFLRVSGGFSFDGELGSLSALRVVVDTSSVDTHHEARDRHLRSGDFLDTAAHPEMVFTADGVQRTGEDTFTVNGQLGLRGISRPLSLLATLNKNAPYPIGDRAEVLGISARGTLKRSEFGMTYGVADNLVGDEVEIIIEIEARRRDERPNP